MIKQQDMYTIALDVGGSYIKTTILNESDEIVPGSLSMFPAKARESKEELINHLCLIIKKQLKQVKSDDFKLLGVGMAFPGPFDYENGISYVQGIDKFDHLYGVNIRKELLKCIEKDEFISLKIDERFLIVFDNDANLFALGEQKAGEGKSFDKSIYLTLGTGAGSAFMDKGRLVKSGKNVPENGWIYKDPFGSSIVDDYISKRGILKLARQSGVMIADNEVKTLAAMAKDNHQNAQEVFYMFGENIGKALHPYVKSFSPQAIILGGQISKSIDLFIDGIYKTLGGKEIIIKCSNDTSVSTFVGIGSLIEQSQMLDDKQVEKHS